jgi:hypothetical protein
MLRARLDANILALESREPALARELQSHQPSRKYFIQSVTGNIAIGAEDGESISPLPQTFSPAKAMHGAEQIYPGHRYDQSLLIAGEDLGWLVNRISQLPNDSYMTHRLPIYWVMRDLERLWIILHVQDWQTLLADPRLRLFAGNDAVERLQKSLCENPSTSWPTTSVTAGANFWKAGESPGGLLQSAAADLKKKQARLEQQIGAIFADRSAESFLEKIRSGEPLRVLGICTRHSVFVRHSMGDWLEAFARLGHQTHLLIEEADHQILHPSAVSEALVEFKPDLVVMINHHRKEMDLVPAQVPFVMWAQDWCDNIACREAGDAQGAMDYVLGHNPMRMRDVFGYSIARYIPAVVAVNDRRFQPRDLSPGQRAQFACDVSFVSNASVPARTLLDAEIQRIGSPEFAGGLNRIYGELEAIYQNGGSVTQVDGIHRMMTRELGEKGIILTVQQSAAVAGFLTHSINSALFRHQTLHWIANLGVDLRIYGRGWDRHPTLSRFARGIADNQTQLDLVYRASRINLHASPHGVMHQRVMEGLTAGGFFLLRRCEGDTVGQHFRAVADWCAANQIVDDLQLRARGPGPIEAHLAEIARILRRDIFSRPHASFVEYLAYQARHGYLENADLLWKEDLRAVSFDSAGELAGKVQYFLANPDQRARTIESMRRPVLDRYTYLATTRRLLDFVAADLSKQTQSKAAA